MDAAVSSKIVPVALWLITILITPTFSASQPAASENSPFSTKALVHVRDAYVHSLFRVYRAYPLYSIPARRISIQTRLSEVGVRGTVAVTEGEDGEQCCVL